MHKIGTKFKYKDIDEVSLGFRGKIGIVVQVKELGSYRAMLEENGMKYNTSLSGYLIEWFKPPGKARGARKRRKKR